jgi:hypothetical protein
LIWNPEVFSVRSSRDSCLIRTGCGKETYVPPSARFNADGLVGGQLFILFIIPANPSKEDKSRNPVFLRLWTPAFAGVTVFTFYDSFNITFPEKIQNPSNGSNLQRGDIEKRS